MVPLRTHGAYGNLSDLGTGPAGIEYRRPSVPTMKERRQLLMEKEMGGEGLICLNQSGQMGAVSVAHYLLVIVLIHGLVLSQTCFTLTGFFAAARLEPSSESGKPYNISARVSKDPPPPSPRPNVPLRSGFISPEPPPP
ncbi:hypothetical protein Ancab_039430 [Ancistrocladus abbreviatus]